MSDDKKDKEQQEYLRLFKHRFFSESLLEVTQKDLDRIKKITNLEEKYREARIAYHKHRGNENIITVYYNNGKLWEVGINSIETIGKYHKLVIELWNLQNEISKVLEKQKPTSSSQPQITSNSEQKPQKNYSYCRECTKKIPANSTYYYHTTKNDQNKFCSNKCFINYYGEFCISCKPSKKHLDTYKLNENDLFGYCWNHYQKKIEELIELEQKRQKSESKENLNSSNLNFDGKKHTQAIVEAMKKGLQEKIERENKERIEKETLKKNNSLNNNSREREREKSWQLKREQNASHNSKIPNNTLTKIHNLELEIKDLETNHDINSQNLLESKKQELEELKEKVNQQNVENKQNQRNNLILGIGLGVFGGGLLGLIVYLIVKPEKNKRIEK